MIQNIRLLKAVVIVFGLVIAGGLGVLLVAIGQRAGGLAGDRAALPIALDRVDLPPGAQVLEVELDGNRIAVRVANSDGGEQLLIYDLASGARLGAISLLP